MSMIRVVAAGGLRVPTEHNPHEYIGREPVEVDGSSLYYRRMIDDGDLVAAAAAPSAKTAKTKEA